MGRAPSNLAEPLLESLSHRPDPKAQPEAEHQLRGARFAEGGLFSHLQHKEHRQARPGHGTDAGAAAAGGGRPMAWGPAGEPWPAPDEAKAHTACRLQVGLCTTGAFTSAAFRSTQNVCAFTKGP